MRSSTTYKSWLIAIQSSRRNRYIRQPEFSAKAVLSNAECFEIRVGQHRQAADSEDASEVPAQGFALPIELLSTGLFHTADAAEADVLARAKLAIDNLGPPIPGHQPKDAVETR